MPGRVNPGSAVACVARRTALAGAAALLAGLLAAPVARAEVFLIPLGAEWRYHAGAAPPGAQWKSADFEDSQWETGPAGFGYGDGDDETLLDGMEGLYTDVYIRREFNLSSVPDKLYLYIRYDDAFAAYLNGRLAARSNVELGRVSGDHEAVELEVFELDARNLKIGRNIVAIRGMNVGVDSSDFSLNPGLALSFVPRHVILGESAARDLAFLRKRMLAQSSYLEKSDHDVIGQLDLLADNLPEAMLRIDFLRGVQRLVALIGDGHSGVEAYYESDNAAFLPFSLADTGKDILALKMNGRNRAFVEPGYPFLARLDGVPIEQWLEMAGLYQAYVSPQLNRRRALRSIRRVDKLREDLSLPAQETIIAMLKSADGNFITRSFRLQERRPRSIRSVPLGDSRILSNNVGYLAIPEMAIDLIPDIVDFMDAARNTDALIIDVRGNGGGRLEVLRTLAPYFLPLDAPPFVTNIAAYRLAPHFAPDHLADRPTFRLEYSGWTEGEREIIRAAMASFQPVWELPEGKFSEWHFMLVNRQSDRPAHVYYYGRPVAVLSNEFGFSATDGFLNGFCEIPGAILVGQPSSGASGRRKSFYLPESDIEISLSSMASFRPNGQLFDGYGIGMDYYVAPDPEDFAGGSDAVLAAALDILERRNQLENPLAPNPDRLCRQLMTPELSGTE